MGIFALLDGCAEVVAGIHDLACKALLHGLLATLAGVADQPIIAPRLKTLAEVKGKALMVHVGGDNMADSPQPLGGGGERFACGVIK